jgi:hypothetical protein
LKVFILGVPGRYHSLSLSLSHTHTLPPHPPKILKVFTLGNSALGMQGFVTYGTQTESKKKNNNTVHEEKGRRRRRRKKGSLG